MVYTVTFNPSLDFLGISGASFIGLAVYFLSGVMDCNHCTSGYLFLVCKKKRSKEIENKERRSWRINKGLHHNSTVMQSFFVL